MMTRNSVGKGKEETGWNSQTGAEYFLKKPAVQTLAGLLLLDKATQSGRWWWMSWPAVAGHKHHMRKTKDCHS